MVLFISDKKLQFHSHTVIEIDYRIEFNLVGIIPEKHLEYEFYSFFCFFIFRFSPYAMQIHIQSIIVKPAHDCGGIAIESVQFDFDVFLFKFTKIDYFLYLFKNFSTRYYIVKHFIPPPLVYTRCNAHRCLCHHRRKHRH